MQLTDVSTQTRCAFNHSRFFTPILAVMAVVAMGIASPAMAAFVTETAHACAGTFNPNLSCVSNDIKINFVEQLPEDEGGQEPIPSCIEGQTVLIDIKLTTAQNANSRYDVLVWMGEQAQNPRGTNGTCWVSSLPGDPFNPAVLDIEAGQDVCLDANATDDDVVQHFMQVELLCQDEWTPDPNGEQDDAMNVPDGEMDIFALVTWFQNNSLQCGTGQGESLEPGVNPKCDASILTGINIEVIKEATLTITKNSLGDTGNFNFTSDVPGLGNFSLDTSGDGTESTAAIPLIGDQVGVPYDVEESVPTGWDLASATCSNGDSPGAVTLEDGENVTCTFINHKLGTVTVVKEATGNNDGFGFTSNVPGLGDFSITTTGGGPGLLGTGQQGTDPMTVPAGNYSINETGEAGWDLTGASCDNGNNPNTLSLGHGDTVVCTFENRQRGTIIVEKQTLPDDSPQSFGFTGNASGSISDGQTIEVGDLVPGAYSSTETVPGGWALSSISCDDANSSGAGNTANFTLEAGETVKCTFNNTQDGSIEVVKDLSATGPASELFSFSSNFNGNFDLDGDGATTGAIGVAPGNGYSVSEDNPAASGWANTGSSCGDGSPINNIEVSPGEIVICTFVNSPLGSATIVKKSFGANGEFDFTGDAPFNGLTLDTAGDGMDSADFTHQLSAGDYDITEDPIPDGFELTDVYCEEDGDQDSSASNPTATLDVELNETVTCTFENTADGTLVIRKETVPTTAPDEFEFVGDVAGDIGHNGELSISGQPGLYSSAELVPDGWALTNIECTGQSQSDVSIGQGTDLFDEGDTNVQVDLAAGETVTCTFTNTRLGSITIDKDTVGGTGAFNFSRSFGPDFPLDTDGDDSETFDDLLPGSYTFAESVPPFWTLSNISCSGDNNSDIVIGAGGGFDPGDNGLTIDLLDGDNITCVFTNTKDGRIRVEKQTDPNGSAQEFDFTGDVTATLTDGQFSGWVSRPPGTYGASEDPVDGWSVTGINCSDGNSSGAASTATFNLEAGEDVTCTFNNMIARGEIVVKKETDPDGSAEVFGFTPSWGGGFDLSDGQMQGSGALLPSSEAGSYSVEESGIPEGWTILHAVCDGEGNSPAAINLQPGETVTCTFTNTVLRSSIIVDKVTFPGGDVQSFQFSTNYNAGFSLTDQDVPNDSGELLPSSENIIYSVSETVPAGWDQTGASCTGGNSPDNIDLQADEIVTCTFENTKKATLELELQLVPALSDLFPFTGVQATSMGDDDVFSLNLAPGQYKSRTNKPALLDRGWDLLSIVCNDGDSSGDLNLAEVTFNLQAGETVRCVVTLNAFAGLTLVKEVDGGDASPFQFDMTLTGADGAHNSGVDYTTGSTPAVSVVVPYTVSEAAGQEEFYFEVSNVCTDDVDQAVLAQPFSLSPGQNVTCTITNVFDEPRPAPPPPPPPREIIEVPVDNPVALILMILAILALGWYFRPLAWERIR